MNPLFSVQMIPSMVAHQTHKMQGRSHNLANESIPTSKKNDPFGNRPKASQSEHAGRLLMGLINVF